MLPAIEGVERPSGRTPGQQLQNAAKAAVLGDPATNFVAGLAVGARQFCVVGGFGPLRAGVKPEQVGDAAHARPAGLLVAEMGGNAFVEPGRNSGAAQAGAHFEVGQFMGQYFGGADVCRKARLARNNQSCKGKRVLGAGPAFAVAEIAFERPSGPEK